jgi:hypothetical protein
MDEWQAQQILEFLRRNPDAREAVEHKIMTISSPCGAPVDRNKAVREFLDSDATDLFFIETPPITARTRVCRHLTRLDLQDCMACADEAELAERLPTSTLTARLRAGMKP